MVSLAANVPYSYAESISTRLFGLNPSRDVDDLQLQLRKQMDRPAAIIRP